MYVIRSFAESDFALWRPLWIANNGRQCDDAITRATWARLLDDSSAVHGIGAFTGPALQGFVHYILHPVTGSLAPAAYMQDVFVDPAQRRNGIARALVEAVAARGKAEKWARLYWLAERRNTAAQQLYKNLGVTLDFTLHLMPLDTDTRP